MLIKCILFLTIINIHIPLVFLECRVQQILRDVPNYLCTSTLDLSTDKNAINIVDLQIITNSLGSVIVSNAFLFTPNVRRLEILSSVGILEPNAFNNLHVLSTLILHSNYLPNIRRGIFENLPILYLSLGGNNINCIAENSFNNMTKLETLRISNNSLSTVEFGIFNELPVVVLSLSNNKIHRIAEHAFYNMSKLKRLYLNGNILRKFEPTVLMNYGAKLEILWLHNNLLTEIDRNLVKGFINLRLLNLESNQISKISTYTFENLSQLGTLILSKNQLQDLDADIFPTSGTSSLKILYLDNNKLTYLVTGMMARLTGLRKIYIFGNPWQCPCLDLIFRWLNDLKITLSCGGSYANGTKPICLVNDKNPSNCIYINDPFYYNKYMEVLKDLPKEAQCLA